MHVTKYPNDFSYLLDPLQISYWAFVSDPIDYSAASVLHIRNTNNKTTLENIKTIRICASLLS
jgi:hypothetical protein